MSVRNERLLQLRDEAFAAAKPRHDEMAMALRIFENDGYESGSTRVGRVVSFADKSFDSEIQKGILKLIPAFEEQAARVSLQADRSARSEIEVMLVEDLEQWKDMYDEADNEGDLRHMLIAQFLILGNALCKEIWNAKQQRCESVPISPLDFAPDPAAVRADFKDATYVCHRVYHTERALRLRYPDWEPPPDSEDTSPRDRRKQQARSWRVDELWLHRDVAEWAGIWDISSVPSFERNRPTA